MRRGREELELTMAATDRRAQPQSQIDRARAAHRGWRPCRRRRSRRRGRWPSRGSASAQQRASERWAREMVSRRTTTSKAARSPAQRAHAKTSTRQRLKHLEQAVDTADGELQAGARRARGRLLLVALVRLAHRALGTLARQALRLVRCWLVGVRDRGAGAVGAGRAREEEGMRLQRGPPGCRPLAPINPAPTPRRSPRRATRRALSNRSRRSAARGRGRATRTLAPLPDIVAGCC